MMPDNDTITRILREYHAAKNSYERAFKEFSDLLNDNNIVILHRKPEDTRKDVVYWSYYPKSDREGFSYGVTTGEADAIIVIAPGPCEEYLPRLEDGKCPLENGVS